MPIDRTTPVRFSYRVPYADTDQMGFVYYANFLVWKPLLEEAPPFPVTLDQQIGAKPLPLTPKALR